MEFIFGGGGHPPSLLPAVLAPDPSPGGGGELELGSSWDGLVWAVPKKRTSYTRKRIRNAPKHLKPRADYIACPECKHLKLLHVLCGNCLKDTLRRTADLRNGELELKFKQLAEKAKKIME